MTIEILYPEVCGIYGDAFNGKYLEATLPEATFVHTELGQTPYFVNNRPDAICIGAMSENTQRRVLELLKPHWNRLRSLLDEGMPMLATGNAGEIFAKEIDYVTEEKKADGFGLFDLTVKTDLFDRYNGKVLGKFEGMTITGFRSQFSFLYGDNSQNYFVKCLRGDGINRESKLEGMRYKNLICTQILGPILPLNPEFTEYFLGLAGIQAKAAFREAALDAQAQRIKEFQDPNVVFGNNK